MPIALQDEAPAPIRPSSCARGLINASGHAIVPPRPSDRPSPHFLKWHRENVFKV